jgi:NADH:ubiquinone oxidoreductase subunit C
LTDDVEEVLMEVVEEFAAFLDHKGADELKPEVADWGRTRLRAHLAKLSDADKVRLAAFFDQKRNLSSGAYRDWLDGLSSRLGLGSVA